MFRIFIVLIKAFPHKEVHLEALRCCILRLLVVELELGKEHYHFFEQVEIVSA